jgi:hypothetical protein
MLDKAWRLVAFKKGRRMPAGRMASSRPPVVVGEGGYNNLVSMSDYPDRGFTFSNMNLPHPANTNLVLSGFVEGLIVVTVGEGEV